MGNRRLIVAIFIVVLLIAGLIGVYVYLSNSTEQASILQEEITNVVSLDITVDEIDMEIKTTGKYATVEETIKNYLNDVKNMYLELQNYQEDEFVSQILSAENIEADEEELTVVSQKIQEYTSTLEQYQDSVSKIADESEINAIIEEKDLSNYYVEIYKNIMSNEVVVLMLTTIQSEIEECLSNAWARIDSLNEVVEFLKENSRYWDLEDGKINFTNINRLTEYYSLLNSVV